MKKRLFIMLLTIMMVLAVMPQMVFADGTTGDFTVTGGTNGTDYSYENNTLTILTNTPLTIANTDPSRATTNKIVVNSPDGANITLNGVNIDVSTAEYSCAFQISNNSGDVTVTLADGSTNQLKSGQYCAGLQKNSADAKKLEIKGGTAGTGTLTATGGNYGAGIGGGHEGSGSNITINGGTVTAAGGYFGAGIGGGDYGSGDNITINGGTITAASSQHGAGIGGGYKGSGSSITINSGTITATGSDWGAGIGGGNYGSGDNITINSGTVTAAGGGAGAGIGGGHQGSGSNITINGGTVSATGGDYGAGIGGGDYGSGDHITINGGTVTAAGGSGGAGIGGGYNGSGSNIIITGGSVRATGGTDANAIGGGKNKEPVPPTLADGQTPVYLVQISTDGTSKVTIDGKEYPSKHVYYESGAEKSENKIYAYVTDANHTLGDTQCHYSGGSLHAFASTYTYDENGHWYACSVDDCDKTTGYAAHSDTNPKDHECDVCGYVSPHTYEWKTENGQYWQRCSYCGDDTDKKDIPTITINGADKVCLTQDYTFSFTLPTDVTVLQATYYPGESDVPLNLTQNGDVYSATVSHEKYEQSITYVNFSVKVYAETSDEYKFVVMKDVYFQTEHIDTTPKDHECDVCGYVSPHTYEWQKENGQYWQKCSYCGGETAKSDIPEIEITGADKVCNGKDYTFTFTLPTGMSNTVAYFANGETRSPIHLSTDENGTYSGTIVAAAYKELVDAGKTTFTIVVCSQTEDSYVAEVTKQVEIALTHTGGTADCVNMAKCQICGEPYGELDSSNHTGGTEIRDAKAATCTDEGYTGDTWCKGCHTKLSDGTVISPTDCPIDRFTDLQPDLWYHEGVHYCIEHGLMNGFKDGSFRPGDANDITSYATRAQVITVLWRLAGAPVVEQAVSFSDVPENAWYIGALRWAVKNDVVQGYTDGTFQPDARITRQEMAALFYRYFTGEMYATETGALESSGLTDYQEVQPWARGYMDWAIDEALFKGFDDQTLKPLDYTTRAQMAMIFYRYLTK